MRGFGRGLTVAVGLAALAVLAGMPATGAPVTEKQSCPVGGERFEHQTIDAYATFGQRPDGKPYGSWVFPVTPPQCPGNGLVMYRTFSKAELARLPALLANPVFVELRQTQTPFYRAAWLENQLSPRSPATAWLLLNASWEAEDGSLRKARTQDEFIDAVAVLAPAATPLEQFALQVRAANAMRELGRFDAAAAALKAMPQGGLEGDPNRPAWLDFLAKLDAAIARGDRDPEPLDLIPARIAAGYCLGDARAPPRNDPYCRDPAMAEPIKLLRDARGGHAAH